MSATTVHVLEIPSYLPSSDNKFCGRNWRQVSRLKRSDKEIVAIYFLQSQIPKATTKRRLSVVFHNKHWKSDPQNRLKSCLDALVSCGALKDDSPEWLELGEIRNGGGERKTVITLEELT